MGILDGDDTEYVDKETLEELLDKCDFEVVSKKATEKDSLSQSSFLSVSTPNSTENMTDEELVEKVRDADLSDVQKYQVRVDGELPGKVEIWRHEYGYSAFFL